MADLPPSASRWRYLDMPLAIPLRLGFELEDNNDDLGTATAAWVVDNRAPAGPAKTVASGRVRAMASRSRSVSVLTVPVNRIVAVVWCLCSVAGEFGTASSEPAGDAPIDTPFVFVTAASENHACPLLEMLQSLLWQAPRTPVVVYDLDVAPPYLDRASLLRVNSNVELRRFDYKSHPRFFNITEHAGQYAWKPVIIKTVVDEHGAALWVDSGNRLGDMTKATAAMRHPSGFFSPSSPGNIWRWVHAGMLAFFGIAKCCNPEQADTRPCCCCGKPSYRCMDCTPLEGRPNLTVHAEPNDWLDKEMCNGALLGFVKNRPAYHRVLVPWFECALDHRCIAPIYGIGGGSEATRGNHRQDQAGVSLLAHFAGLRCNSTERDAGFVLHRDKSNDNEACREHYVGHADLPSHDRNPR